MSDEVRHLLVEALRLAPAERAELASELLASMDGEQEDDAERAWVAEIERRAQRAIRGESQGRDADTALDDIVTKLRRG